MIAGALMKKLVACYLSFEINKERLGCRLSVGEWY